MSEEIKIKRAYLSVIVSVVGHFALTIYWAASLAQRVEHLEVDVNKVAIEQQRRRERVYSISYLQEQIRELKRELRQLERTK